MILPPPATIIAGIACLQTRKEPVTLTILMASQMSHVAYPGSSAYCTTKGALLQLAKGIALDYVGQGIRANNLPPGGIATHRQLLRFPDMETAQREWGARHPMGR